MAPPRMPYQRRVHSSKMSPELDPYRTAKFTPDLVPQGTAEASFTGPISGIPRGLVTPGQGIPVTVSISDGAVVIIEGRSHPSLHWIEVAAFAFSETRHIGALNELRATVRHNTGKVGVRVVMQNC
jgi:hypothetical protein